MRKISILCILFLAACSGGKKTDIKDTMAQVTIDTIEKSIVETPENGSDNIETILSSLPFGYAVTDTGNFDFGLGDGVFAVIKSKDQLVDTIDAYYGMQKIDDDHYMYCTIEGNSELSAELGKSNNTKILGANIGSFIMIDRNGAKIDINKVAPDFGWFAQPSILNEKVYYYQVKERKNSNYIISAAEFNPKTQETKSQYIFNDDIGTDDGGYFKQAYLKNGLVVFENNNGKRYKFSKDFKLQ